MHNYTETSTVTEKVREIRPFDKVSPKLTRRRLWVDRLTRRLVTLGGAIIIFAILAILFVIAAETYPLFKKPTATKIEEVRLAIESPPIAVGVDEYREITYVVTASGIQFFSVQSGAILPSAPLPDLHEARVVAVSALGRGPFALGLSDGRVIPVEVRFSVTYPEGKRHIEPELIATDPILVDPERRPIRLLAHVSASSGPITAAAVSPTELVLVFIKEKKALIGPSTREEIRQQLSIPQEGEIRSLALDGRGEDLFVGTSAGQVIRVDLRELEEPKIAETVMVTKQARHSISILGFLLGDRTLIVGDTGGGISSWQVLWQEDGQRALRKIYDFKPHDSAVVVFAPSRRDKGFLTADTSGAIHLKYGTTGVTLLTLQTEENNIQGISFAPKTDGFVEIDAEGWLSHWYLDNPHPEITWKSLFGKVWYEGYQEPQYVWQSTGGTDDFEPKFSLTPLIYGTLKGTFYALLFAIPIALLGAIYTSQFMHPALKGIIKPTVEIMAALPSVVLGFIAGLWLAPRIEQSVPGVLLMPVVITLLILLVLWGWNLLPQPFRGRFRSGTEVFLLLPVVLIGGWLSLQLGGLVEAMLLGGDYRTWLLQTFGLTYDQRNSLVVGFAMGFAVIPLIFTIAEDSLSNVPQHLVAGSLALGATRWQTAVRVVLPTASPGIFSAIMIGLGRAVGETMIVLMATGNTPVMDWNIFTGFRALSANIAVELPEAPHGGTLYRVLFLAALILFIMTSLVNTIAELVRLRLRKRYRIL